MATNQVIGKVKEYVGIVYGDKGCQPYPFHSMVVHPDQGVVHFDTASDIDIATLRVKGWLEDLGADLLHYSDNDSDTYCHIDLDDENAIFTDDPDGGVTCPKCLSEMADDKPGIARQREKVRAIISSR